MEIGEGIPTVLSRLLDAAFQLKASDIHVKVGVAPMYRVQGLLRPVDLPAVSADELNQLCEVLSGCTTEELKTRRQVEFSCEWSKTGRFRGHYYQTRGKPALALRAIPVGIPDMQDLRLPAVMRRLCAETHGIILVTGATGMGKSTTLAAMLNYIARNKCCHVVTIEDPVEFIVEDGPACVTQCEVGLDVDSFEQGLVAALRQDPDVVMIGEVRDRATLEVAMRAAISGHLVLAAAHFTDTLSAIAGIVSMAPPAEQAGYRFRLADALRAIISQRLLTRRDGASRVLATEVLINEPSVRACIQDEAKTRGIRTALARGRSEHGSHTMDQSLLELLEARMVTLEVAQSAATSPTELAREVNLRRIAK